MSAPGDPPSNAKAIRVVAYSPPRARASDDSQIYPGPAAASARQDERELAKQHEGGGGDVSQAALSPSVIPVSYPPPSRGRLSTASYTTNSSQPSRQSASSRSSHLSDSESEAPSVTGTQRRGQSRRRNFVAVLNDDKKTFSLVPQTSRVTDSHSESEDAPRSESALSSEYGGGPSVRSSQLHSFPTTPRVSQASSHEGVSSYASSHYERPSSSLAGTIPDRCVTPSTPTSFVPSSPGLTITGSPQALVPDSSPWPWNSRMVGGLRRVPNLPSEAPENPSLRFQTSSSDTLTPLPAVTDSEAPVQEDHPPHTRSPGEEQASPHSSPRSSDSDQTNYRVHRDIDQALSEAQSRSTSEQLQEHVSQESLVDPYLRAQPSFATARTGSTDFGNNNYRVYSHSDDEGEDNHSSSPIAAPSARALRTPHTSSPHSDSPIEGPSARAFRTPHSSSTQSSSSIEGPSARALRTPQSGSTHSSSPIEGPSARALRTPRIPQLEPQSSLASLQSVSEASIASDSTNIRVYGPASPALEPVPEFHELRPAQSFLSTVSTLPDTDNYVVYGRHSPAALSSVDSLNPPSPSGSYAPLLRATTAQSQNAQEEQAGPSSPPSNPNYVVHGESSPEPSRQPSPITSEPGGTVVRHASDAGYYQENLPTSFERSQRSQEGFGYFRARSRSRSNLNDEARPKKSLKSVKTSISSIINEDTAESFFAGQAYLDVPAGEYESIFPSVAGPSDRQRQLDEQREREQQQREREASAWEGEGAAQGPMALPATPHQWSSQLSTVLSESEPDSTNTRSSLGSVSLPGSPTGYGSHERRNSRGWSSSHSRQMLSISSSLAADLEAHSRSRSDSHPGSIERPSPSHRYQGRVRHHDEDGDGLADLQVVTPRPSRSRLSDTFNHNNTSERSLHSSASTRSFNNGIPTWAKLYYGSGERRYLRSTSISSASELSSRPESMLQHSDSPVSDHFPMGLWSGRRRPQEAHPGERRSITGSMRSPHGSTDDHVHDVGFRRSIRRMTSSVWSPHLRRDVRAQNRYTIWDTPSVAWSDEGGMFGRRNLQVVLFVVGFLFPFAWMMGAVIPLPQPSPLAMVQRDSSYSDLGVRPSSNEFERHIESVDELRYQNAKWWRMLNRGMSVIGLLIVGAVIGLVIAAYKQGWVARR